MSSKEAPSETPRSLSAFSTDISKGAESSALEPAWRTGGAAMNVRRVDENGPGHGQGWFLLVVVVVWRRREMWGGGPGLRDVGRG